MNKLVDFLTLRSIELNVINQIINENIDEDVILLMNDQDTEKLTSLFPKYGDRLAVLDFCNRNKVDNLRKTSLLDTLNRKIKQNSESKKSKTNIMSGNMNAYKKERTIEIGWLNYDFGLAKFVQVYQKKGGGNRRVKMNKTDTKQHILEKGQTLFFPNGQSSKGLINKFVFDVVDYQRKTIDCDKSLLQFYEETGFTLLRFYITTKFIKKKIDYGILFSPDSSDNDDVNNVAEIKIPYFTEHNSPEEDKVVEIFIDNESLKDYANFSVENQAGTSSSATNKDIDFETTFRSSHTDFAELNVDHNILNENLVSNSNQPNVTNLILHRTNIFTELVNIFKKQDIASGHIIVELIGPNGIPERAVDSGGVFRDVLSTFWNEFYEKCTTGTFYKIPTIRHDFQEEEWSSITRVFSVGWLQEKYLPIRLVPTFLEMVLFDCVNEENMIDHFLKTLSRSDAEILTTALSSYDDVNKDELLDIMSLLECKQMYNSLNIKSILKDIAQKELVQRPKYIIDIFSKQLKNSDISILTFQDLQTLYNDLEPTPKNILKMLYISEIDKTNTEKTKIFCYLKKFVREADQNMCINFVRYCTGADILTHQIKVEFNESKGFCRTPVGHTCVRMLEISLNYDSFIDLRGDMSNILSSSVWIMDII